MKYNDILYNMSKTGNKNNTKKNEKEIALLQEKLLRLIIEKIKVAISDKTNINDDFIEICFSSEIGCYTEDGFNEIKELLSKDSFHGFASEYCIVLVGTPSYLNSAFPEQYKLRWFYKNYSNNFDEQPTLDTDIARKKL